MIQPVASRQAKQSSNVKIRDRIKELRRMKAKDLVPHPHNWRQHPEAQSAAIRGLLTEIGYANALIGRELRDGRIELTLIRNKSGGSEMVCDPVVELFGCRVGGEAQDVST